MFMLKRRIRVWELRLGKIRMPYPQWGIREWIFVVIIDKIDPPQRFLRGWAMSQHYCIRIAFGKCHLMVVLCDD